jgi:chitin disaccharide deacetylase
LRSEAPAASRTFNQMARTATTTERKRLVINADDFGFTEGINRGIIEAFEAGALRSASLMAQMPAFDSAARAARHASPSFGVGVHLTLTAGQPLVRCPSLVDSSGNFHTLPQLIVRSLAGRVRAEDVERECAAQIARCRDAGLTITHLDGHHHVHMLPRIRGVVADVMRKAGLGVRRAPAARLWHTPASGRARRLPERLVLAFLAGAREDHPPLRSADHFAGTTLLGAPRFRESLLLLLDSLPDGVTELMVHPGYVDQPLPGNDRYTVERERELRALTSPEVLERLRRGDIELLHFGEL